jgi:hypothetical protein
MKKTMLNPTSRQQQIPQPHCGSCWLLSAAVSRLEFEHCIATAPDSKN